MASASLCWLQHSAISGSGGASPPIHFLGRLRAHHPRSCLGYRSAGLFHPRLLSGGKTGRSLRALPPDSRVAMVVTKAPSEPFRRRPRNPAGDACPGSASNTTPGLPTKTLPTRPSTGAAAHGVFVSTRKGRSDYHRTSGRAARGARKATSPIFYDHYGYERYDFVAQLDADHVPAPDYLFHMLRPFADPKVGYVSAPSICDAQRRAKAGRRVEGSMPRPACMARSRPVTMAAWRRFASGRIMRCAPPPSNRSAASARNLAEDHSTTLMMNAGGWRGVHALDAIAHGDGPQNLQPIS